MTHRWGDPIRDDQLLTKRTCIRCGLQKHARHENGQHWQEFYDRDGNRVQKEWGTPPCEPAAVKVAA